MKNIQMKKLYIHILLLAVSGILSINMQAQDYLTHEFSVYGGAGLNTLKQSVESPFDSKNGAGALFGVDYTYSLSKTWGILVGAEMSFLEGEIQGDNLSDKYMTKDIDNNPFEYRISKAMGLEDEYNATFLNIPVKIRYQTSGNIKFYGAAGVKVGIPVKSESKMKMSSITVSGYYPEDNQEYTDETFMGFGTFKDLSNKKTSKLKTSFMLSLEVGAKYAITNKNNLYAGVYFDYGLNDISKNEEKLIEYNANSPQDIIINSTSNSTYSRNNEYEKITSKIIPMAIGLKIGVSFGI